MDVLRRTTIRRRPWLIAVGLSLAAIVGVWLWARLEPAPPTILRSAVWTDPAHRGDLTREVPVQGRLVPEHIQWLSASCAGRVAKVAVRPGSSVDPDTIVVTLENSDLELAALDAERQALSAQSMLIQIEAKTGSEATTQASELTGLRSDLKQARLRADAAVPLASEGLIGKVDLQTAQMKAEGLQNRVAIEDARSELLETGRHRQLAAIRAELGHLREIVVFRRRLLASLEVRAEIRGIVQEVPLEIGKWVAVGTVLAKVAQPRRLKAELKLAETSATEVHIGLPVRLDASAQRLRGHVERIDPSVVAGNVGLDVVLDEPEVIGARPDQSVTGYVEIEVLRGVVFVTRPSGVRDHTDRLVFRVENDGVHASATAVRFGAGSPRYLEVTSGLNPGDEIIVSDTSSWVRTNRIQLD